MGDRARRLRLRRETVRRLDAGDLEVAAGGVNTLAAGCATGIVPREYYSVQHICVTSTVVTTVPQQVRFVTTI